MKQVTVRRVSHIRYWLPAIAVLFLVEGLTTGALRAGEQVVFEDAVAEILADHCVDCHNPSKRRGELDLSSAEGLVRGGESGAAFHAGDPEKSHLLELLKSGEMPKKGDPLSPQKIEAIEHWITGGAQFRKAPQLAEEEVHQHDVLPIVLLRCAACHGPRLQQGGLDLSTAVAIKAGGNSGPALIPGDPDQSPMIQRIESEACPPQDLLLKFFVKRPPESEVLTLRKWIAAGAPVKDIAPDVATEEPDPLVTNEDRQHWAFQPPHAADDGSIDQFVGAKLQVAGLGFSPEADRDTLIRRAYLDLIGMPPSLAEWQQWRSREDEGWFPAMIDHLLASPHYGERWGRYWLDIAGYSDSEGGTSADPVREVAWKYRDYVIQSFNEDKPYDRFLLEQLAGDELIDYEHAPEITQEMVDNLIATGFLRMGMDQTGSRTMNFVPERLGVIGDAINVLGSGVMGLTMDCVRCHSHKYDPIPQRDYYRLKAVFQGALDEFDWMSFKTRSLEIATEEQRRKHAEVNPALEAELKSLTNELKRATRYLQMELLMQHYPELSEEERETTVNALRKADNQLTRPEKILVEKYLKADLLPEPQQPATVLAGRERVAHLELEMLRTRNQMVPPLAIRALWDRGQPSPTYILQRGEHNKPGRLVGPGVPSALTDGQTPLEVAPPFGEGGPTGRRLAFAKWLTQPDHPLTSRVMVNRIWYHHFGSGLVRTLENFGVQGDTPSHPELLDWLAVEFTKRDWSIKDMHRLIMNSRTYRQSSRVTDSHLEKDPQNRLVSRMPLRRMNAEALRDSLLFVSGQLEDSAGGPPDPVTVDRNGLVSVIPTTDGGWRRSVYLQYRRTEIPTMMDTFDYPEMGPNCVSRSISTVSPQSLLLMNNLHVRELAAAFADRVESIAGPDSARDQVEAVYQLALSRYPSSEEMQIGVDALRELEAAWNGSGDGPLVSYCHTILNSAAFLYID